MQVGQLSAQARWSLGELESHVQAPIFPVRLVMVASNRLRGRPPEQHPSRGRSPYDGCDFQVFVHQSMQSIAHDERPLDACRVRHRGKVVGKEEVIVVPRTHPRRPGVCETLLPLGSDRRPGRTIQDIHGECGGHRAQRRAVVHHHQRSVRVRLQSERVQGVPQHVCALGIRREAQTNNVGVHGPITYEYNRIMASPRKKNPSDAFYSVVLPNGGYQEADSLVEARWIAKEFKKDKSLTMIRIVDRLDRVPTKGYRLVEEWTRNEKGRWIKSATSGRVWF